MHPAFTLALAHPGLVWGLVGSLCGLAGGLIGTYFSIKNTKGPRKRAFVIKAALACWILVLAFVAGMLLLPPLLKLVLIPLYTLVLVAGILWMNKKQARLGLEVRLETSWKRPTASTAEAAPRHCPRCGVALKSDAPEGLCPACLLQQGLATEGGEPPGPPPFTPPSLAELAKFFPQLEILESIGRGGMGAVYRARQRGLDRLVALKILAPRSGEDADFAERFTREACALAKLSHPNIVAVYDFGVVTGSPPAGQPSAAPNGPGVENSKPLPNSGTSPGGTMPPSPSGQRPDATNLHYFIMEYVDGLNLRQVEQAGKLTPRQALQIVPQICAALQFAHDEGIVHRDIKPENILLDTKGRVKIADFGLAKIIGREAKDFRLTRGRDVMGTPHYMAPEQVEHPQAVDHRADIYSLGVVFYEMLTGELPLGKFPPPSQRVQVDVQLDEVVLRALEKEPERRYQKASEVQTRLETLAACEDRRAQPATPHRRRRLITGLFRPFAVVTGRRVLLPGLAVILLAGWIGSWTHTHFDGVLDTHTGTAAPLWFFLSEGIADWLSLGLVLLLFGRLFSKTSFRASDLLGAQALARWPTLLISLLFLPPAIQRFSHYLVEQFQQGGAIRLDSADAAIFLTAMVAMIPLLCWRVWLMYHAYSVCCSIRGAKALGTFIPALILAEIVSKWAVYELLKFA